MADFIIGYYGGKQPESAEAGQAHQKKWQAWIDSLGDKVVNPGTPLMSSTVLGPDIQEPLMGFAVIRAENIEEAVEIAKGDPFMEMGSIQVAQMMNKGE